MDQPDDGSQTDRRARPHEQPRDPAGASLVVHVSAEQTDGHDGDDREDDHGGETQQDTTQLVAPGLTTPRLVVTTASHDASPGSSDVRVHCVAPSSVAHPEPGWLRPQVPDRRPGDPPPVARRTQGPSDVLADRVPGTSP